jgi:hypothetical protein
MEEPESDIMAEVARGDLSAFRVIVERYQKTLMNFISRFIDDKTASDGICQ